MSIDTFRLSSSAPPVTWMDVARRLARLEPVDHLWKTRPIGLVEVMIDWSCATFFLENVMRDHEALIQWLGQVFHGRVPDSTEPFIILDGPAPSDRLPIEITEASGSRANLSSLGSIEGRVSFVAPKASRDQDRPVQVVACHSVKGGTGRTTVAVALANAWSDQLGRPVLLVDADLEAPGLSYIFRSTRPEIDVSLEDIVTMAHAEPDGAKPTTIAWACRRLKGQQLGNLLILPLRRDLDELASSGIRAEHVASPDRPYAFADLLANLAAECGCGGVVVDVRAGLVPLAAQLVLDPQVARVVVTSIAGQSLEATISLMDFISRELRKAGHKGSQPLLVVNRIPGILRDIGQEDSIIGPFVARVQQAIAAPIEQDIPADRVLFDSEDELSPIALIKLGEVADLQVPSKRWHGFSEQLENSGFSRRLNIGLLPWLDQFTAHVDDQSYYLAPPALEAEDAVGASERRRQLADFTSRFIAAETSDEPVVSPLITGPMRALVSETAQLPIVVCEGAKGTGKTLTARYLLSKETWAKAAEGIGGHVPEADGAFLPVLGSVQASAKFQVEIDQARSAIGAAYGFGSPQSVQALRMMLRERASGRMSERQWSDLWLDVIAWSAGFFPEESGAGELFLSELSQSGKKFVALIEGVEELYDSPSNPSLAPMLRALLLDLPLRLRGAPGRPLGLILFARRDTVEAGVAQNRNQFRQQYQDYALTWNESSVLELAAWLATESKALKLWDENFYRLSTAERERRLSSLWGTKLGPDDQPGRPRVQEAYTANWVIAALSDLQERLVARDLVRFLHNAAAETNQSESRERYGSRLLFPKALRDAMGPTSRAKVEETEEEIPELKPAFQKFRDNSNIVKAPLDSDSIAALQLTIDDIEALKTHGIVLGDSPPYEVPELFRMGLGLRHAGARYSVIGTRRRARQRLAKGI